MSTVIVNESFVHQYLPHTNPIGKVVGFSIKPSWRIVGVVGDTRTSLTRAPQAMLYMPYNGGFGPFFGIAIRTVHPIPSLSEDVAGIIRRNDPSAGAPAFVSVQHLVENDAATARTSLELLGVLAAIALLLALSGIYSVVSYSTERRYHEIGVRMALGARAHDIFVRLLGSALSQCAAGILAGAILCAFTTRLLSEQLFQVSPLDPATLAGVTVLLALCTACAAFIPAWRAASAPASTSLRYE
jgi:ABC-type antimicrobial peptide transport system permease subunit